MHALSLEHNNQNQENEDNQADHNCRTCMDLVSTAKIGVVQRVALFSLAPRATLSSFRRAWLSLLPVRSRSSSTSPSKLWCTSSSSLI